MVGYQLKILTTAIFATTMLGKRLSRLQWLSLVLLTVGVSLAQLHAHHTASSTANTKVDAISDHPETSDKQSTIAGFIAVILAACTSGFSGIYFEKILKGSKTSLWVRNLQMGFSSIFIALFATIYRDGAQISENGSFMGIIFSLRSYLFASMWWLGGGCGCEVCRQYPQGLCSIF